MSARHQTVSVERTRYKFIRLTYNKDQSLTNVLSSCSFCKGVSKVHVLLHHPGCYPFPLRPVGNLLPSRVFFPCRSYIPLCNLPILIAVFFLFSCGLAVSLPLILLVGFSASAKFRLPSKTNNSK